MDYCVEEGYCEDQGCQCYPVRENRKDHLGLQGHLDLLGLRDLPDHQDHLVHWGLLGLPDLRDRTDLQGLLDHLDRAGLPGLLGHQGCIDTQSYTAHRDHVVVVGYTVHLDVLAGIHLLDVLVVVQDFLPDYLGEPLVELVLADFLGYLRADLHAGVDLRGYLGADLHWEAVHQG